ncbi:MAG: hypothetical protein U0Z26_04620, partial [Anaerolineales bacterium]
MQNEPRLAPGATIAIQKPVFNSLLQKLQSQGFEVIGPHVENQTLVYAPIQSLEDLPRGFVTEQEAGHFRLVFTGHTRYFDVIPGAQSWKQFLFPARIDLFELNKSGSHWDTKPVETTVPAYAFIGVRGCELAAIQIQDNVFIRPDFTDPIYRARREKAFLLAVNCLHPAGTCFCASMGTGPRIEEGADLILTELEDVFLLKIGSELGRNILNGLPIESASAFLLNAANKSLERAALQMGRTMETEDLPELILNNLDSLYWRSIGERCLSCANCTQ